MFRLGRIFPIHRYVSCSPSSCECICVTCTIFVFPFLHPPHIQPSRSWRSRFHEKFQEQKLFFLFKSNKKLFFSFSLTPKLVKVMITKVMLICVVFLSIAIHKHDTVHCEVVKTSSDKADKSMNRRIINKTLSRDWRIKSLIHSSHSKTVLYCSTPDQYFKWFFFLFSFWIFF